MAHVLVIDDEVNIRMMLRLALQHAGHTVEAAADGIEGLEKFGDGSGWDLVLLDQRMPGMEGLEVLRAIRQRDTLARVIMITAFGTIDLAAEAIQAGVTDFLRKPFTMDTLRGAVQAALGDPPPESEDRDRLPVPVSFDLTTVNGYRFESSPRLAIDQEGNRQDVITVYGPAGEARPCTVVLPAHMAERVKAYADREEMPGGERFWQALCGEALANYLWQHVNLPPDAVLRVEDLTSGLRHWVDTVLTAGQ